MVKTHPQEGKNSKTIICFPYDKENIYAFYCARYKDISYNEFFNLGTSEFMMKLNSIPESEPLYNIIKSRTIVLSKIKDKEERKHWRELKRINQIPAEYLSSREIDEQMKEMVRNGKRFN